MPIWQGVVKVRIKIRVSFSGSVWAAGLEEWAKKEMKAFGVDFGEVVIEKDGKIKGSYEVVCENTVEVKSIEAESLEEAKRVAVEFLKDKEVWYLASVGSCVYDKEVVDVEILSVEMREREGV